MGFAAGQNLVALGENIYIGDTAGTFDNTGASPGDEFGVIRIGSVFSGTNACFINGIAANNQPVGGSVFEVTIDTVTGKLGFTTVTPNGQPGSAPVPRARVPHSAPQPRSKPQPAQRPTEHQAMLDGKVEKLQATVAQQQKQIDTLTAQLKEHAETFTAQLKEQSARIQKVSAVVEVYKPAPKVVVNKP